MKLSLSKLVFQLLVCLSCFVFAASTPSFAQSGAVIEITDQDFQTVEQITQQKAAEANSDSENYRVLNELVEAFETVDQNIRTALRNNIEIRCGATGEMTTFIERQIRLLESALERDGDRICVQVRADVDQPTCMSRADAVNAVEYFRTRQLQWQTCIEREEQD